MRLFVRGNTWTAMWWFGGKRYCRSTGKKSKRMASVVAQQFLAAQKSGRTDLLEATKLKRTAPSIEQVCAIYKTVARCRKETAAANVYKLGLICRLSGVSMTDCVMALDASFGSRFHAAAVAAGWSPRGISSTVRQARSVFSRRVISSYGLTVLPGWLAEPVPPAGRVSGFQPFPAASWRGCVRDVRNHPDPRVWLAFVLMSRCGMGNDEVISARGTWLVENGIRIEERPYWKPKSYNRCRTIPIRPARFAKLFAQHLNQDAPLIPHAKQVIYRTLNPILRKWFPNRQKAAYELRKHAGSLVATRDGIFAASKFLGDNVATVERYYAALLSPLRPL